MFQNPYTTLNDFDIEKNLLDLAARERASQGEIILHLMLVKERKLYAPAGYASLFDYCVGKLGFSRSVAYRRKAVVEKAAEFPQLLARLKSGRLLLCAAAAIAAHLKEETAEALLDAVEGMSHREVESFLVKKWCARPAAVSATEAAAFDFAAGPSVGNGTADACPNAGSAALNPRLNAGSAAPDARPNADTAAPDARPNAGTRQPRQRTIIKPVSPQASRVSVTLSDKTLANLKRAKEILGQGDDEVLCRALDRLLDQIAPERRQARRAARAARKPAEPAAAKPATPPKTAAQSRSSPSSSRRGPTADRDQVTVAAGNQCSFVARDGTRCNARTFLEIDHIQPWALGGPSCASNQRPLCRTHNAFYAAKTFGPWRPDDPHRSPARSDA